MNIVEGSSTSCCGEQLKILEETEEIDVEGKNKSHTCYFELCATQKTECLTDVIDNLISIGDKLCGEENNKTSL